MTATAELLTLPGVRLLTARRLPLERREVLLTWLAAVADELPAEAVTVLRDSLAHESLYGPALDIAWQAYREAAQIALDVAEGRLDWRVVAEDLRCTDRTAAAIEIAHEDANAALRLLARGCTTTGETR